MLTEPDPTTDAIRTSAAVAAATQQSRRACPICGDRGRPVPFAAARIDAAALDSYAFASRKAPELMHHRLVACAVCDLVYADPAPDASVLERAYLEASFDSGAESRFASRTYGRVVDRILPRLPGRDGALDVGTGDGAFLTELLARGFTRVAGIEPSAAPVEAADPEVRPLIRHQPFTADAADPGSLSLVTCFQTIEHLHDPLDFCTQAAGLLRSGGAILLVAHNRRALSARLLGQRSPIFDIEHLQLFSPASAQRLLERAGFRSVTSWSIVNSYPLSYWNRLSPLPATLKSATTRGLALSRLGDVRLPAPVGNMAVVGFRR